MRLSDGYTAYRFDGPDTGDIVVMIHGGTIPMCLFAYQLEAFVGAGFRVLRYDQFGRGESDRPDTEYNKELFSRQLKELLDSLGIFSSVHLLGPSFGGTIAVNFASLHPQRVRSMVLVAPALNFPNSDSPTWKSISLMQTPVLGKVLFGLLANNKVIGRGRKLVPGGIGSPCEERFLRQFSYKGTARSFVSTFQNDAYGNYLKEASIADSKVKNILLLRGALDKEITEKMTQEMLENMPNARYVEMEKSGHAPGTDNPDEFNRIVIDYLKSLADL